MNEETISYSIVIDKYLSSGEVILLSKVDKLKSIGFKGISVSLNESCHDLLLTINWDESTFTVISGTLSLNEKMCLFKARYIRLNKKGEQFKTGDLQKEGKLFDGQFVFEFDRSHLALLPAEYQKEKILP